MDPDSTDEMVDHLIDFFDQVATDYDAWAGGLHGRVAARLVELVNPKQGQHALDVGCGTGLVSHLVAAKVRRGTVIGIDLSERMLSVARARMDPNTQYVGMAAERLVFRPASFDLVTMGEALVYLADPIAALEEAHRVLKPRGRIALSVGRRSLSTVAQELFFQGLAPLARRHYLSLPRFSSERSRFGEPSVLPELLANAGFKVTGMTEMVLGGRTRGAREWIDLMAGAGPLPYTIIRSLGPRYRAELEEDVEAAMESLGEPDDAFRYHHAYLLAVAEKR